MLKLFFASLVYVLLSVSAFAAQDEDIRLHLKEAPAKAPDISFKDADGSIHTLKDFKGKVVLVNFWATWCKPCVEEMPALSALQSKVADKDIVVLPISLDYKGAKAVKAFYKEQNITNLPVYIDKEMKTYAAFGVRALPSTYVVDKQGEIVLMKMGMHAWDGNDVVAYLMEVENELF